MSLHPAIASCRRGVREVLADLEPGDAVVVACSGGADSLALASASVFEGHKLGLRVVGATVDHGLQPGSADQAARVVAQLVALGVDETATVRVEVVGEGHGPEAAARQARYDVLEQLRVQLGAALVLLGHTRDDQAETVLLGLTRGSGGRSLAGMRRAFDHYARPLLDVSRDDTVTACQVEGLDFWDDPHNEDPSFTRVRVRRTVLPLLEENLGPGVAAALARTADQMRDDVEALDDAGADGVRRAPRLRRRRRHPAPPALRPRSSGRLPGAEAGRPRGRGRRQRALPRPRPGSDRPRGKGDRGRGAAPRTRHRLSGRRTPALPADPCAILTLMDAWEVENDLVEVLFTEKQIVDRLGELAQEIERDYEGKDLVIVGVLRGAVMVMADLARALGRHVEMDWMAVSSYGSGTKSSGVVRILKDLDADITGRHVVIVDEIIDTGLTLSWLTSNLGSRGPASVEICTLLRKPEALQMPVDVKYVGWDIPNEFVVGYGLDYRERYRNLRDIGTLAPHVYS